MNTAQREVLKTKISQSITDYKKDVYVTELIASLKNDRDFFDHAQDKYKKIFVQPFLRQMEQYLDAMQISGNVDNFIDIGCGKGFITNHIQKHLHMNGGALGIDMSTNKINFAKTIFPETRFEIQNGGEIEQSEKFNLVVCTEVLEHCIYPEDLLSTCKELSNKNILVSVPHEPYWSLINMARGKYISRYGSTPDHKQKYSKKSLGEFLTKNLPGREIAICAKGFWLIAYCKKVSDVEIIDRQYNHPVNVTI